MMKYSIFDIFARIFCCFSISPSRNANAESLDNRAFFAFLKGPDSFNKFYKHEELLLGKSKEFLAQKFEAHLGALHSMRWNWQCYRIGDKFKAHEKNKCKTYCQYANTLYDFVFRMYADLVMVKPTFVLKKQDFEKIGTLTEVVNSLSRIWKFFFDAKFGKSNGYKLSTLFKVYYKPKMKKESAELKKIVPIPADIKVPLFIEFDKKLKAILADEQFATFVRELLLNSTPNSAQLCTMVNDDKGVKRRELVREYEYHLVNIYFMRKKWHCAKLGTEFDKSAPIKCQKYRNYLDILYEYLLRVFSGVPATKPTFRLKTPQNEHINGSLIEVMDSLAIIMLFLFNSKFGTKNEMKFEQLFANYSEPFLINEKEVERYISVKELCGDNSQTNFCNKFDKQIQKMVENDQLNGLMKAFANNGQFYSELFEHSELGKNDGTKKNGASASQQRYGGSYVYETHLGILYLMRQNWHCAKIVKQIEEEHERNECQKYRKYLHILYEYLYAVYYEAVHPTWYSVQFPTIIKPKFEFRKQIESLLNFVYMLNIISMFYFDSEVSKEFEYKSRNLFNDLDGPILINEEELNFKITIEEEEEEYDDDDEENSSEVDEVEKLVNDKKFDEKLPRKSVTMMAEEKILPRKSVTMMGEEKILPRKSVTMMGEEKILPRKSVTMMGEEKNLPRKSVTMMGEEKILPRKSVTMMGEEKNLPRKSVTMMGEKMSSKSSKNLEEKMAIKSAKIMAEEEILSRMNEKILNEHLSKNDNNNNNNTLDEKEILSRKSDKSLSKEMPRKSDKSLSKEMPRKSDKSLSKEMPRKSDKSLSKEMPRKSDKSLSKEMPRKSDKSLSKEMPRKSDKSLSEEMPRKSDKSLSEEMPRKSDAKNKEKILDKNSTRKSNAKVNVKKLDKKITKKSDNNLEMPRKSNANDQQKFDEKSPKKLVKNLDEKVARKSDVKKSDEKINDEKRLIKSEEDINKSDKILEKKNSKKSDNNLEMPRKSNANDQQKFDEKSPKKLVKNLDEKVARKSDVKKSDEKINDEKRLIKSEEDINKSDKILEKKNSKKSDNNLEMPRKSNAKKSDEIKMYEIQARKSDANKSERKSNKSSEENFEKNDGKKSDKKKSTKFKIFGKLKLKGKKRKMKPKIFYAQSLSEILRKERETKARNNFENIMKTMAKIAKETVKRRLTNKGNWHSPFLNMEI